jgi:hypothetical protein
LKSPHSRGLPAVQHNGFDHPSFDAHVRLPTEILALIAAQLAPEAYQLPTANNLCTEAMDVDVRARRADYRATSDTLWSLFLTSQLFRELATQHVYRLVWPMGRSCEERLVPVARFLRTLLERRICELM